MSDVIESIEYRGHIIQVVQDSDPESPRAWDNLGSMVCWHRRYNLGDIQPDISNKEWLLRTAAEYDEGIEYRMNKIADARWISRPSQDLPGNRIDREHDTETTQMLSEAIWRVLDKHYIMLPLFLYDHSGITMGTSPFSCPWDSGQIGWIIVDKRDVRKEYSWKNLTKQRIAKIMDILKSEVKTYDQYLCGEVYGYRIYVADPELEDDEYDGEDIIDSCYGFYDQEYMVQEAKAHIDYRKENDAT